MRPILKAKSIQASGEYVLTLDKLSPSRSNARLVLAGGNKARFESTYLSGGAIRDKMLLVSDGAKQRLIAWDSTGKEREVRKDDEVWKHTGEAVLAAVSRYGVFMSLSQIMIDERQPKRGDFALEKDLGVSDMKFGKKEVVSGKETQAVEYRLTPRGAKEGFPVVVWIDTKTNLPVKRVVTIKDEKMTMTVTETYEAIVLDGKIDNKDFLLPK